MYMSSLLRKLTMRSGALPTKGSVKCFVQMVSFLRSYPELSVLVSTTVENDFAEAVFITRCSRKRGSINAMAPNKELT